MPENEETIPISYVEKALLVADESADIPESVVQEQAFGTEITVVGADAFFADPKAYAQTGMRVVACIGTRWFSPLLETAYELGLSLGFLSHPELTKMQKRMHLPPQTDRQLEIALRAEALPINLVRVNGRFISGDFIVGSIPVIRSEKRLQRSSMISKTVLALRQLFKIRLQRVDIETQNGRKITTAMSGSFILQRRRGDILVRLSSAEFSFRDNQILLVVVSPFSIVEFVKTAVMLFAPGRNRVMPRSVGYIKSKAINIVPSLSRWGREEDGSKITAPFTCELVEEAVSISASEAFWEEHPKIAADKETVKIDNLPDEKETERYHGKHIPLFSYASEERFKDLFLQLRGDAKIDNIYLVLMLLSTLLATVGLFADSAAVVIGAMLLAPLMAPIVSLAMGLLRADTTLLWMSLRKIGVGVVLALGASALVTWLLPDTTLTAQIRARINPTLLDLAVAILSGIAAAYSKSFKEIIQSLAGVAIAVALVPPLASAGIGLGIGSFSVFAEAFLLFFTNLVGIVLAATLTFYVLGFSGTFRSKRSIAVVLAVMMIIAYPLYRSYTKIVRTHRIEQALSHEHFDVHGKPLRIRESSVGYRAGRLRLDLVLEVRTPLSPEEMRTFKRMLERRFGNALDVHIRLEYVL